MATVLTPTVVEYCFARLVSGRVQYLGRDADPGNLRWTPDPHRALTRAHPAELATWADEQLHHAGRVDALALARVNREWARTGRRGTPRYPDSLSDLVRAGLATYVVRPLRIVPLTAADFTAGGQAE